MAMSDHAALLRAYVRPARKPLTGVAVLLVVSKLVPLAGPELMATFIDRALAGRPTSQLTTIAAAYVALAVVGEGLRLLVSWLAVRLAWGIGNGLREDLARHAVGLDMNWHADTSPGALIERVDGDVDKLSRFFSEVLVNVAGNAVLLVGVIVLMVVTSPTIGLSVAAFGLVAAGVLYALRSFGVSVSDAERGTRADLFGEVEERLNGLDDLRANGAGAYAVRRHYLLSGRTWRAVRTMGIRSSLANATTNLVFALGSALAIGLGVAAHRAGHLSAGEVFLLFRYSQLLRQPLEQMAEQFRQLQMASAGAARAARLLATAPAIRLPDPGAARALPAGPLGLEFDGVAFAYHPGEPTIERLTLAIAPGAHVGVVGRTGSGKTTLAKLALRLWDVDDGAVRIGGVDVRDADPESFRARVALVSQDVQVFHATVRENLTLFGRWDADDARLARVLHDVGLGRWFDGLAHGLATHVGGAAGLSAGEAQLLAFARAFLADPGLVVLDEPSSRLDPATEASITHATDLLLAGRTAIVIAHRLRTLDRMDEILVLEDGRAVEHGSRQALGADDTSRWAALLAASGAGTWETHAPEETADA